VVLNPFNKLSKFHLIRRFIASCSRKEAFCFLHEFDASIRQIKGKPSGLLCCSSLISRMAASGSHCSCCTRSNNRAEAKGLRWLIFLFETLNRCISRVALYLVVKIRDFPSEHQAVSALCTQFYGPWPKIEVHCLNLGHWGRNFLLHFTSWLPFWHCLGVGRAQTCKQQETSMKYKVEDCMPMEELGSKVP